MSGEELPEYFTGKSADEIIALAHLLKPKTATEEFIEIPTILTFEGIPFKYEDTNGVPKILVEVGESVTMLIRVGKPTGSLLDKILVDLVNNSVPYSVGACQFGQAIDVVKRYQQFKKAFETDVLKILGEDIYVRIDNMYLNPGYGVKSVQLMTDHVYSIAI